MSNLSMSWGWKNWLFTLPIVILGFLPLMKIFFFKGDVTKDLVVSEVSKRRSGATTEVIGLITNGGSHKWSSVTVKAEFFDAAGVFLDEDTEYLRSEFAPGAKDHFKITIRSTQPKVQAEDAKLVVKIAGGMSMPF